MNKIKYKKLSKFKDRWPKIAAQLDALHKLNKKNQNKNNEPPQRIKYRGYEILPHAKGWCVIYFNNETISTETGDVKNAKKEIDNLISGKRKIPEINLQKYGIL